MDRIRIRGGKRLAGTIPISGAKNAALKLMAACLLTDATLTLGNVPSITEIAVMAQPLAHLGVSVTQNGSAYDLTAAEITDHTAPYNLVSKMRAGFIVLGPLLARHGKARVSLPGGDAIGTRPVDMHLAALEQMGATITLEEGYINAIAPNGLTGTKILFPKVSVMATENILMAATVAQGETIIMNAAREPEIGDLATCLIAMGAQIEGVGTSTLTIQGVHRLTGAAYDVMPDRIEAGTYAIAAALTGGDVLLKNAPFEALQALFDLMIKAGVEITQEKDGTRIRRTQPLHGVDMMTEPYPGFPTDLQAQFITLMTIADGASMVTETIFENRFMHVPELVRMGANITVHQASALIRGVSKLQGAQVMATDIRASVSLLLAGLVAEGDTTVSRIYHLDRGYERLEEKLRACGADIERIHGDKTDV
jgi:UDP-N-acetylglucosamine 1-carboxyvinyltransferase